MLFYIANIYIITSGEINQIKFNQVIYEETQKQLRYNYRIGVLMKIELEVGFKLPQNINLQHLEYMYDVTMQLGLPINIVFRQIMQESAFNPTAISRKKAYGYMQLMPKTYSMYYDKLGFPSEFKNDDNPYINIYIGLMFLKELYDFWNDWELTLASYNAGISKVMKYEGIPPYRETKNYIKTILYACT